MDTKDKIYVDSFIEKCAELGLNEDEIVFAMEKAGIGSAIRAGVRGAKAVASKEAYVDAFIEKCAKQGLNEDEIVFALKEARIGGLVRGVKDLAGRAGNKAMGAFSPEAQKSLQYMGQGIKNRMGQARNLRRTARSDARRKFDSYLYTMSGRNVAHAQNMGNKGMSGGAKNLALQQRRTRNARLGTGAAAAGVPLGVSVAGNMAMPDPTAAQRSSRAISRGYYNPNAAYTAYGRPGAYDRAAMYYGSY